MNNNLNKWYKLPIFAPKYLLHLQWLIKCLLYALKCPKSSLQIAWPPSVTRYPNPKRRTSIYSIRHRSRQWQELVTWQGRQGRVAKISGRACTSEATLTRDSDNVRVAWQGRHAARLHFSLLSFTRFSPLVIPVAKMDYNLTYFLPNAICIPTQLLHTNNNPKHQFSLQNKPKTCELEGDKPPDNEIINNSKPSFCLSSSKN